MKISFEIDNCIYNIPFECLRMRKAIGDASEMIEDLMNYGPDTWEKTCEDLQEILEVLDVLLIDPK